MTRRALSLGMSPSTFKFVVQTMFFALIAHALGYLIHEYAHSVFAWALG